MCILKRNELLIQITTQTTLENLRYVIKASPEGNMCKHWRHRPVALAP